MIQCDEDENCIKNTLEKILHAQRKHNNEHTHCETSCEQSIIKLLNPSCISKKNTVPFILYCDCEPFKVEGVTTFFDHCTNSEKFYCFTTFIFRIKDLKGDCAKLELLKFDSYEKCVSSNNSCSERCICSPCCQLHCKEVDDLIPTGVCVKLDISCFCGIQCLPAVCL
ncbi:MAG TPA: CotY/CotZ family spore coat protein [Pseudoneobacillus sp.]|nr:CotY/CotZ family spore coat protein [Pseudoneobacillus sp.]